MLGLPQPFGLRKDEVDWIATALRASQRRSGLDCHSPSGFAKTGCAGLPQPFGLRKDGVDWIATALRASQRRSGLDCHSPSGFAKTG